MTSDTSDASAKSTIKARHVLDSALAWVPRVGITAVALYLAVSHASGSRLNIDTTSLALVALAIIPWLAPFVKSFEAFGIKVELERVQQQVNELQGKTESSILTQVATSARQDSPGGSRAFAPAETMDSLVKSYNETRDTMKPGWPRSQVMTEIVGKMISLATSGLELSPDSLGALLKEADGGKRLYAYAYIYARPRADVLDALVNSVVNVEVKPFGQFWGIQALGKVIAEKKYGVPQSVKQTLEKFRERFVVGTDRYYALTQILETLRVE